MGTCGAGQGWCGSMGEAIPFRVTETFKKKLKNFMMNVIVVDIFYLNNYKNLVLFKTQFERMKNR